MRLPSTEPAQVGAAEHEHAAAHGDASSSCRMRSIQRENCSFWTLRCSRRASPVVFGLSSAGGGRGRTPVRLGRLHLRQAPPDVLAVGLDGQDPPQGLGGAVAVALGHVDVHHGHGGEAGLTRGPGALGPGERLGQGGGPAVVVRLHAHQVLQVAGGHVPVTPTAGVVRQQLPGHQVVGIGRQHLAHHVPRPLAPARRQQGPPQHHPRRQRFRQAGQPRLQHRDGPVQVAVRRQQLGQGHEHAGLRRRRQPLPVDLDPRLPLRSGLHVSPGPSGGHPPFPCPATRRRSGTGAVGR